MQMKRNNTRRPWRRLRLLWEQAHGAPAGEVHALIGPDSVAPGSMTC